MNFAFNEEQLEYRERARRFAREVIRPAARKHDEEESIPWEVIKEARKQGFGGGAGEGSDSPPATGGAAPSTDPRSLPPPRTAAARKTAASTIAPPISFNGSGTLRRGPPPFGSRGRGSRGRRGRRSSGSRGRRSLGRRGRGIFGRLRPPFAGVCGCSPPGTSAFIGFSLARPRKLQAGTGWLVS